MKEKSSLCIQTATRLICTRADRRISSYEGKVVGYLGEVHPLVAGNYGIGERAYVAVIDIQDILEFCGFNHKFTGIAKYPAVTRDLSMVVPKHILAGQIEDVLAAERRQDPGVLSAL